MTTQSLESLAVQGQTIYDQKLKAKLEPEYNGQVVAIHVASEDFALGRNSSEAVRSLRSQHPDGRLVILTVGPEPDYGLAARFLAGEIAEGRAK